MRLLGLDLGTRTLGMSISDETKTVASTYGVLRFEEEKYDTLFPKLKEIVEKEQICAIVLGFPKNMNNTIGTRALAALEFKEKLEEKIKIEVFMQDERLSTKEATYYMIEANMRRKKRKKKVDSLAANIILQSYLDKGGTYGTR